MIDVKDFEAQNRNLTLIEQLGERVWVYLDNENGEYYAKGPFAYHEGVVYLELGKMTTHEIEKWISELKTSCF